MMQYLQGTTSHSTTGVKTITTGFLPVAAEIVCGPDPGSTQSLEHFSEGITDGTNSVCDSHLITTDGHAKLDRYSDRLASVWKWDSGSSSFVEEIKVIFDSFTATQFKYNVITPNVNRQLRIRVWG